MSKYQAGRELDALVAEKVMGWLWLGRQDHKWLGPPSQLGETDPTYGTIRRATDIDEPERPWWLENATEFGDLRVVPHYSTDIAAAFLVVEKLNAAVRYPEIQFAPTEPNGEELWCVSLVNPADVEVVAETAPLAICRAALAALGVRDV